MKGVQYYRRFIYENVVNVLDAHDMTGPPRNDKGEVIDTNVERKNKEYMTQNSSEIEWRELEFKPNEKNISDSTAGISRVMWVPENVRDLKDIDTIGSGDVEGDGTDALAWYQSFHFYPNDWGIYILDRGIYHLVKNYLCHVYDVPITDMMCEGLKFLFNHEFFHYITDMAAFTLESLNDFRSPYHKDYYINEYLNNKSKTTHHPLEEALANAHANFRILNKEFRTELKRFMNIQPRGYKDYKIYWNNFQRGKRKLASLISNTDSTFPIENIFDCNQINLSYKMVPVKIVYTISKNKVS